MAGVVLFGRTTLVENLYVLRLGDIDECMAEVDDLLNIPLVVDEEAGILGGIPSTFEPCPFGSHVQPLLVKRTPPRLQPGQHHCLPLILTATLHAEHSSFMEQSSKATLVLDRTLVDLVAVITFVDSGVFALVELEVDEGDGVDFDTGGIPFTLEP